MEESGFVRDKTPYVVFPCSKCKQFMYVKTTQKTRKCLRCGRQHKVVNVVTAGEIVEGMTEALNRVKQKQSELGGNGPELRSSNDFKSSGKVRFVSKPKNVKAIIDDDYSAQFEKMLSELADIYQKFPYYLIEIMGEDFGIPDSELKILFRNCVVTGIIKPTEENLYKFNILKP